MSPLFALRILQSLTSRDLTNRLSKPILSFQPENGLVLMAADRRVPKVFITSHYEEALQQTPMQFGVVDVLRKPTVRTRCNHC